MQPLKRFCQWTLEHRYPAALVVLGLLLASPSLWTGLQLDDFTVRSAVLQRDLVEGVAFSPWEPFTFLTGEEQRTGKLLDRGLLPWWTDPKCRLAFWRPLTAATHILDYRVWPEWPWLMHLQSLAWFALLIWATAVLYRRLIGPKNPAWAAALAALLFTLDDTHAWPAGWLANRNAVLAGLFGVLALIAHDRWRRDGWRAGALWAPVALAIALLCKEAAASTGGYLLAYAIFLDRAPRRSRCLSLLPCLAVGVVWYGFYKALGFGAAASGVYIEPAHDPIGFVCKVARNGPILLLGQWGLPASDLSNLWSASAFTWHWLWAAVFLTTVAALLAPLVARDASARFWTTGMLLSILPVSVAFPMDRLLMFAGIGAMGLLAQALAGLKDGADWVPRLAAWRWPARVFAGLLVVIHLLLAPVLFLLMLQVPKFVGHGGSSLVSTYPDDPQVARQTLVVVNPSSLGAEWFLIQLQDFQHRPLPQRSLQLTSACSHATLTRTDARTLAVRVHGGYVPPRGQWPGHPDPPAISAVYIMRLLDNAVRSDKNPLKLGQVIELTAARIEITELLPDGRPAEVTFRFRVPLEDPSLRWLKMTREGYAAFAPPKIGESVEVSDFP